MTRLLVAPFDKALHDRAGFSCGVPAIDAWLRQSVSEQIKANRLRLWCATDPEGRLVGAYALAAHAVDPAEAGLIARPRERHRIPVLYLPVLAVDLRAQGTGVGRLLMAHAIERTVEVSRSIAVAALLLDVLEDDAVERRQAFYLGLGFQVLDPATPRRLYLTLADAVAALG